MKVAHLMGSLNRGGAETLVVDICRASGPHGLQVIVVHRKGGALLDDLVSIGIPKHQITPLGFYDFFYLLRLRRLLMSTQVSVVHTHQVLDALLARLALLGLKQRVVLSLHGHGIEDRLFTKLLRKLAIRFSDLVLFVSNYQKQHYTERYGPIPHGKVLHNGIDFSKLDVVPTVSLREEMNIGAQDFLFGSVGNFTSGRDHLVICRFLALLKQAGVSFHFVFVGAASLTEPGRYEQCVAFCQEQELTDQVHFLGGRSDVPSILKQLNAFVYSTVHDTFGIAVVEAMAAGLPTFVNDWPVMQEISNGGKWAHLYETGDEKSLLTLFLDFYSRQDSYRMQSQTNSVKVKAQYSIKNFMDKVSQAYLAADTDL